MKLFRAIFLFCLMICGGVSRLWAQGQCWVTFLGAELAFGSYSPIDAFPVDSAGAIGILCNPATEGLIRIDLSPGNGSYASRIMIFGAEQLRYNLYLDSARTIVWGDGTGGTGHLTLTKQKGSWLLELPTIYGRIPPGQDVAAGGPYSDTITVTVNW